MRKIRLAAVVAVSVPIGFASLAVAQFGSTPPTFTWLLGG